MPDINGRQFGRGGLALALALAVTVGCAAQGRMTNVWHDPAMAPASLHKVYVVAVRKDAVRRRAWEDAFVEALARQGVSATASYRRFEDASPDTQQVIDVVNREGYDAVLTTTRLADQETSQRVQGQFRQQQFIARNEYGYSRLHSYWVTVQDPDYIETDTIIRLQTDVWAVSAGGGHLVWSGTLNLLESVAGHTAKKAVDDAIVPQLVREGMLPGKSR